MKTAILTFLGAASLAVAMAPAAHADNATAQPDVVQKTIYVLADDMGLIGPDGKHHDSFLPASFVLKAGQTVQLTFVNYDDMAHTFTDPDLHLNVVVKPGQHVGAGDDVTPVSTTVTFTPTTKGQFRWHCNMPCDTGGGAGWAMRPTADGRGADGYMAGYVVVM